MNRIGGVMVSVLAFSVIDLGFETDGVKPMIIKLEIAAFPPRLGGSELAYCVGRGERWGDM